MNETAVYFVIGTTLTVIGALTSFLLSQTWASIRRLEDRVNKLEVERRQP